MHLPPRTFGQPWCAYALPRQGMRHACRWRMSAHVTCSSKFIFPFQACLSIARKVEVDGNDHQACKVDRPSMQSRKLEHAEQLDQPEKFAPSQENCIHAQACKKSLHSPAKNTALDPQSPNLPRLSTTRHLASFCRPLLRAPELRAADRNKLLVQTRPLPLWRPFDLSCSNSLRDLVHQARCFPL